MKDNILIIEDEIDIAKLIKVHLSELDLHSIEQPIKPGQLNEMALLCDKTPLPIALERTDRQ